MWPRLLIEKFMDGLHLKMKTHYPKSMLLDVVQGEQKRSAETRISKPKLQEDMNIKANFKSEFQEKHLRRAII